MGTILEVKNAYMSYLGGYTGLIDINFTLEEGGIVCFCGKKFSGKTNLSRAIAGLERLSSGEILWKGVDIKNISLKDRNLALLFDESSFNDKDTLFNNIAYPMKIRNMSEEKIEEKVNYLAKLFSIDKFLQIKVKDVSRKTLEIALFVRMFVIDRELYIIDNPFKSFSKEERQQIFEIAKNKTDGKSIIFLTDDFDEALNYADKAYILDHCKVVDYANYNTIPNHIATAIFQGGEEVYATMRKIDNQYYLDILSEDVLDIDRDKFVNIKGYEGNLIPCREPISDIYIDKNILATRNNDGQLNTFNYYDLASMYNIAKIERN